MIDLRHCGVKMADGFVGDLLMEEGKAVVEVLRNLIVELLYMYNRFRVSVAFVKL